MSADTIDSIIRSRPKDSYTDQDRKAIRLFSITNDSPAHPYGNALYSIQKYPSDLDLVEKVVPKIRGREDRARHTIVEEFARRIRKTIHTIATTPDFTVGDIKCGIDQRFDLSLGILDNGVFEPNITNLNKMVSIIGKIGSNGKYNAGVINKILAGGGSKSAADFDHINDIVREYKIIRWKTAEIDDGRIEKNGIIVTLEQAIETVSQIKIDAYSIINGRFLEITNQIYLGFINREGKTVFINTSYDFNNPVVALEYFENSLREDIEKLFYSDVHYAPFKACKRIFSLARILYINGIGGKQTSDAIRVMKPIISGGISQLSQIAAEIETIGDLEHYTPERARIDYIDRHVAARYEAWRVAIGHIIELTTDQQRSLIRKISSGVLGESVPMIKRMVNDLTMKALRNAKYWPVPALFLPTHHRYARPFQQVGGGDFVDDLLQTAIAYAPLIPLFL